MLNLISRVESILNIISGKVINSGISFSNLVQGTFKFIQKIIFRNVKQIMRFNVLSVFQDIKAVKKITQFRLSIKRSAR